VDQAAVDGHRAHRQQALAGAVGGAGLGVDDHVAGFIVGAGQVGRRQLAGEIEAGLLLGVRPGPLPGRNRESQFMGQIW
jgi:hypothetical protein